MKIAYTILSFLLASSLLAQSRMPLEKDLHLLRRAFAPAAPIRLSDQFALANNNHNELQAVFSGLFLAYKSFVSSQDNQRCGFHPTCSEFGLEAVKKFGIIRGFMCTCDRLTRCNGFSPGQYEADLARRRLKDPVEW